MTDSVKLDLNFFSAKTGSDVAVDLTRIKVFHIKPPV